MEVADEAVRLASALERVASPAVRVASGGKAGAMEAATMHCFGATVGAAVGTSQASVLMQGIKAASNQASKKALNQVAHGPSSYNKVEFG